MKAFQISSSELMHRENKIIFTKSVITFEYLFTNWWLFMKAAADENNISYSHYFSGSSFHAE